MRTTKFIVATACVSLCAAVAASPNEAAGADAAVELEFQAKGEPSQSFFLSMKDRAKTIVIKDASNSAPRCYANADDKANRCLEAVAQKPLQPKVFVRWLGTANLFQVSESVCDALAVRKGPNHPTTGTSQFLLLPVECHELSRFMKLPEGETFSLDSESDQQFLGRYTIKLVSVAPR
ncbi:hypothetical protein P245_19775 [Comamonas thiooxydans]|uniref:Uncharacterized protein n=1 Tax=Comamonas thiooxydans TaxID=363952 RepID=A0A0E3BBE2_9BURK|nr:hypothetical protein [Comamonas thiooxydans]KGG87693.1 hypothetical protein P245_19775 [Comamonas thiooxydans]